MKLLHLADLHLDSPFIGLSTQLSHRYEQLVQAPYQALAQGVSFAINEEVDIVVIVGDIYDSTRQTIYAQHYFVKQMERLNQVGIPVVLSYGNHDYLTNPLRNQQLPDNVSVFDSESVEFFDFTFSDRTSARFYGFSYLHRWINDDKVVDFPQKSTTTDYTIGLLHGDRGNPQEEGANYAPYRLEDLIAKNYDYWALGHIHRSQMLNESPLIQYAGTTQGRHRNENGDHGGYLVEFSLDQPTPTTTFISLAPIVWETVTVEVQTDWQASQIVDIIQQQMEHYLTQGQATLQSYLLTIELTEIQRLDAELIEQIEAGQLLESLTALEDDGRFVEVIRIDPIANYAIEPFDYDPDLHDSYQAAYVDLAEGALYQEVMADMFNHQLVKEYLPTIANDPKLRETIVANAQQLMIETIGLDLTKGGDLDEN